MDAISSMEFDYIASGHYANVVHPSADQMDKPSMLELSKDSVHVCLGFESLTYVGTDYKLFDFFTFCNVCFVWLRFMLKDSSLCKHSGVSCWYTGSLVYHSMLA